MTRKREFLDYLVGIQEATQHIHRESFLVTRSHKGSEVVRAFTSVSHVRGFAGSIHIVVGMVLRGIGAFPGVLVT